MRLRAPEWLHGLLPSWASPQPSLGSAAVAYRHQVLAAVQGLFPEPVAWPRSPRQAQLSLAARLPDVARAVAAFKPHLPTDRQADLEAAWAGLRACLEDPPEPSVGGREGLRIGAHPEPDPRRRFQVHMARLLAFSETG